jgi:hypothetical protein
MTDEYHKTGPPYARLDRNITLQPIALTNYAAVYSSTDEPGAIVEMKKYEAMWWCAYCERLNDGDDKTCNGCGASEIKHLEEPFGRVKYTLVVKKLTILERLRDKLLDMLPSVEDDDDWDY